LKILRHIPTITLALALASSGHAQNGVSDDRVSLPEGPGSLEGVGENVQFDANMGVMSYGVPISVPQGFAATTPSLSLGYSSGAGSSSLGIGWSLGIPNIERMTYRGLPTYGPDDDFAAGGEQIVRIPGTDPPIYRARFEGGFARYTWVDAGSGAEGYWIGELPDGSRCWFGAQSDGTLVPTARLTGAQGSFRYMLVEKQDVHGHRAQYEYTLDDVVPLISRIGYVFSEHLGGAARYSISFDYGERRDADGFDLLSDAGPAFETVLSQRLEGVNVYSNDERIRRYVLSYEGYASSGGFTRLTGVQVLGLDGSPYPIHESFGYSRALGGVCDDCERPFLVDMGAIGDAEISAGTATLLDINGDGLPDAVDTREGSHRFYLNAPTTDGRSHFADGTIDSALGSSASHRLDTPTVKVMDVNGDGFTDMVNLSSGAVLYNRGTGDWLSAAQMQAAGLTAFDLAFDAVGEAQIESVGFLDYENDKHIDFIISDADTTTIYRNEGAAGFSVAANVTALGDGTSGDDLTFDDINGDGLLDATIIRPGVVRFRLNLGWGQFSDWRSLAHPYEQASELDYATLEDLNGDALADLVVVQGDTVRYLLNSSGVAFSEEHTLSSDDIDGSLPARGDDTGVIFADMNGSGSTDIVWIQRAGTVQYLELFPARPNLLSRIENGIGKITEITYGTSLQHMARDIETAGGDLNVWAHRLPHPMIVVDASDTWDALTDIHEIVSYHYHDGYYDGVEKRFRGYARVETVEIGDANHEPGRTEAVYDVGASDPYYNGQLLSTARFSDDRPLRTVAYQYDDCDVAEADGALELPVRHICQRSMSSVIQEGAAEDAWVTVDRSFEYDGYGNLIEDIEHGVTAIGCVPCGADCEGDEISTETTYIVPGAATDDRWILHAPSRTRTYGEAGSDLYREVISYYDGDAFEGLPLGQLTLGDPTRVTQKVEAGSDRVIEISRLRFDAHGNSIEALDPLGTPDGQTHRRHYTYDDDGLRVTQVDALLEDAEGAPMQLRRSTSYDPVFSRPVEMTAWMRVVEGEVQSTRRSVYLGYDVFGRPEWRVLPGDTVDAPTETYTYELASPASRIISRRRSTVGGALDLESVRCADGRGRVYQRRTRLDGEHWQVSGFTEFDLRGQPVRQFQPYAASTGACDTSPDDALALTIRRDADGRQLEAIAPDGDERGTASVMRIVYGPLTVHTFDTEDTDASSPHADTPASRRVDGLGRLIALDRRLAEGQVATTTLAYDPLGRAISVRDAAGNTKTQTHDLLDRITQVTDYNAGTTRWQYDDASNLIAITDARDVTVEHAYDGLNRLVRQWDPTDPEGTLVRTVYDTPEVCPAVQCSFGAGQVVEVHHPAGRDASGYDERGRRVRTRRTVEAHTFAFEHAFDNVDREVATVYPDGRRIERAYDGGGRLLRIPGVLDAATYDAREQITSATLADGTVQRFGYDDRVRMIHQSTENAAGNVLQGFGVTRDRTGNVTAIEDLAEGEGPDQGITYTLDAWFRTVRSDRADETLEFDFDLVDNVVSRSDVGALSYGADAGANALSSAPGLTLTYDRAGLLSTRGDQTLSWDHLGRLTGIDRAGDAEGRYVYGPGIGRLMKTEGDQVVHTITPDFEIRDGLGVIYVRLGGERIARLESPAISATLLSDLAAPGATPDGAINVADAWLAQAASAGVLEVEGQPAPVERVLAASARALLAEGRETTFLHSGPLHNITLATRDGVITGQQAFTATGTARWAAPIDPYGFTGQEQDRSGFVRFLYRTLDPKLGRWLSPDPAFRAIAPNQIATYPSDALCGYAYVGNGFSSHTDPTGLGKNKWLRKLFGKKAESAKAAVKDVKAAAAKAVEPARHLGYAVRDAVQSTAPARAVDSAKKGLSRHLKKSPTIRKAMNDQSHRERMRAISTGKSEQVVAKVASGAVKALDAVPGVGWAANKVAQEGIHRIYDRKNRHSMSGADPFLQNLGDAGGSDVLEAFDAPAYREVGPRSTRVRDYSDSGDSSAAFGRQSISLTSGSEPGDFHE
jgi:RHS repeat-associated protein